MRLKLITNAAELIATDCMETISLPAYLNPALPLTIRLPAFESASQLRHTHARIHAGLTTWAEFASAVTAHHLKHH